MESSPPDIPLPSTQGTPMNLHDLQNYLVTFNKEIESNDQPVTDFQASSDDTGIEVVSLKVEKIHKVGDIEQPQMLSESAEISADIGEAHKSVEIGDLPVHMEQLQSDTEQLPSVDQSNSVLQVRVPLSEVGNQNFVRVISLNNEDGLQLASQASSILTPVSSTDHNVRQLVVSGLEQTETDNSEQVAVLASVAANTSTVNEIQTLQLDGGEINGAQLVALQNSADSSQPQLVAVQTSEELPIDSDDQTSGQMILNTATGEKMPTLAIMPAENGEMSYVLIVSNPDGEKEGAQVKPVTLDMSMFDVKESKDMMEEIVDDDGNVQRVLKIAPRFDMNGSPSTLLQCRYCDYTSPKRYLLMRHMKCHSEDKPHKCNICDRGFKTMASLQNHVNTHTGTRPHKCKECESAFTTSGELVRHIRYKHTFEKPHKCTECEYASVELSKLKRHMRSHTGERPYQCSHCNYASPDTYKLKRHMRIHTGEKPYACDICHARFTQSNSLKAHKLIHSGNKPVFQCELCPTTCGRRTDLKIHMMKLHTSTTPLQCKKCTETFPDRYTCKMHMKSHEGERCYKCEQCDYAAMSLRHLETHMLTHTGEKPFECDECPSTFRQKQLLKRHKGLYHAGESMTADQILIRTNQKGETDERAKPEVIDSALTADQLIQGSLLTDLKEGKLGNTPKVVIVHPDGSVEEVTSKLQSLAQEKSMDEVMMHIVSEEDDTQESEIAKSNAGPEYTFTVSQTGVRELDGAPVQTYTMISSQHRDEGTQATLETDSEQSNESHNDMGTVISTQTIQKTANTILVQTSTDQLQDDLKIDLPSSIDVNGDPITFYTSPTSIITTPGISIATLDDNSRKRKGSENSEPDTSKRPCTE